MTTDSCEIEEPSLALKLVHLKHTEDKNSDEDDHFHCGPEMSKTDSSDSPRSTSHIVQDEEVSVSEDTSYAGFTHVLSCPMCNFLTLSVSILQQHAVGHASRSTIVRYSTFTCQKCSCLSTERAIMLEHIKIYHRNAQNPVRLIEERHTLSVDSATTADKLVTNNNNNISQEDNLQLSKAVNKDKDEKSTSKGSILLNNIFEKCQQRQTSSECNGFSCTGDESSSLPTTPNETALTSSTSSASSTFPLIPVSPADEASAGPKQETVQGSRRRKLNNPGRVPTVRSSTSTPEQLPVSHDNKEAVAWSPNSPPILTSSPLKTVSSVLSGKHTPHSPPPCKKAALTAPPVEATSAADLELIRRATATAHAEAARDSGRSLTTNGSALAPTSVTKTTSKPRVRKTKTTAKSTTKSSAMSSGAASGKVAAFLTGHGLLASLKRDTDFEVDSEQALDMSMKSCNKSSTYHLPASSQLIEMASRLSPHSLTTSVAALTSQTAQQPTAVASTNNSHLMTTSDVADVLHRLGAASALFHQLRGSSVQPASPLPSPGCPSPPVDPSDTECSSLAGNNNTAGFSVEEEVAGQHQSPNHKEKARNRGKNCGGGSRPHRQNFTPTQNKILMEWYQEHKEKPYPSTEETNMLTKRSDLTYPQVKKWFANKRARTSLCIKKSPHNGNHGEDDPGSSQGSSICSEASPTKASSSVFSPFLFPTGPEPGVNGEEEEDMNCEDLND